MVEGSGFRFFPVGPAIDELRASDELQEYAALTDPMARRELIRRRVFVGLLPRLTLPDLVSWCDSWSPDLIISDNCEFAGRVTSERLDIPHATLKVDEVDLFAYAARSQLVPAMDALRGSVGLPPDPDGAMLYRYLYLLNEPHSFSTDAEELPPTAFRCRRVVFDQSGDEQPPQWLRELPPRATVFATAGTAVNRTPGLLESFTEALRDEPINAIMTIGRDRDPREFGGHADNVRIERYVPLSLALPACDLVLSHCGHSTMYAALDPGLPLVNVPVGMDQPENAARCERLKLGLTIDASARSAQSIRGALREVLADPRYRANAERVRRDMYALPGPREVVAVLERVARDKQPFAGSARIPSAAIGG